MKIIHKLVEFIHKYFLVILLLSYLAAGLAPQFGLFLRDTKFAGIKTSANFSLNITPSLLMLSFIIFNAGLGIRLEEIKDLARKPMLAIAGFLTNIVSPILLILLLRSFLSLWHNNDELQNLITGLALIIAMPIAGSSTAWSQNANGNLFLSLGLVLLSTLSSPLTTPVVLHLFSFLTTGDYSEDLQLLAQGSVNIFMCIVVVIPSLLGIATSRLIGNKLNSGYKGILKLSNFSLLLLLNYSNAATSLPQVFAKPDLDYLVLIFAITTLLCALAFLSGWLLSKLFKTNKSDQASIMFGLGMNNNGTGLVFATSALADHPVILLPIVFYTLIQQITAAVVDKLFFQNNKEH